jgi:hypothetical protein
MIIPFGPYYGKSLSQVPLAYLRLIVWGQPLDDDLRTAIEIEIYARMERNGEFGDGHSRRFSVSRN